MSPTSTDGWIQTFTGRKFWPLEPAGEINLRDIAHSLALQCRFNGHTKVFYSVAQHSVLASLAIDPQYAVWGLMHDAAEAYIGDIVRPLKRRLCTAEDALRGIPAAEVSALEDRILRLVAEQFSLPWPMPTAQVAAVDLQLLHSERLALLGEPPGPWVEDERSAMPSVEIEPQHWMAAEASFLARAKELGLG